MANKRGENQILVAVWMDDRFLVALDKARKIDHRDRSTFIRFSISEELDRRKIPHDKSWIYNKDRAGTKPESFSSNVRRETKYPEDVPNETRSLRAAEPHVPYTVAFPFNPASSSAAIGLVKQTKDDHGSTGSVSPEESKPLPGVDEPTEQTGGHRTTKSRSGNPHKLPPKGVQE